MKITAETPRRGEERANSEDAEEAEKSAPGGTGGTAVQSQCMRRSVILAMFAAAMLFAQKRPFDANALMELKRIGDPQISPDGQWVTFTVQSVDVAANKKPQQIWITPLM